MITLYALIASVRTFCGIIPAIGTSQKMLSLINSSDGGYVLTGYISPPLLVYVVKLDSLMNTTWSKIISGGSGNAVIQNFRGNYIVVGGYGLVMEIDPTGNILWGKNIQVFSVSSRLGDSVISGAFYSVIQSPDSNYFLIGAARAFYEPDYPYTHIWIVRLDQNGNILWHSLYTPFLAGDAYGYRAYPTNDSGFILISYKSGIIVSKFNKNGVHQFSRMIDGYAYNFYESSVVQAGNGYYYFSSKPSFGKMDSSGNILWMKQISSIDIRQIVPTYDKGYLILGRYSLLSNPKIAIIKFDSLDQVEWARFLGDSAEPYSAVQTPDSGFAIVGSQRMSGYYNIFFVKVDKNGDLCSPCGSAAFTPNLSDFSSFPYPTPYPIPFSDPLRIYSLGTVSDGNSISTLCFSSDISEVTSDLGVGLTLSCRKINVKYDGLYDLEIYGIDGRIIMKKRYHGDRTIDISNLRTGTYKLIIKTNRGEVNHTFIKY